MYLRLVGLGGGEAVPPSRVPEEVAGEGKAVDGVVGQHRGCW